MNNLPIELVNKIIMMNRTTYPFMSELKNYLTSRRRTTPVVFYDIVSLYPLIIL